MRISMLRLMLVAGLSLAALASPLEAQQPPESIAKGGRVVLRSKVLPQSEITKLADCLKAFQDGLVEFFGLEAHEEVEMYIERSEIPGALAWIGPRKDLHLQIPSSNFLKPAVTGNVEMMRWLNRPLIMYIFLDRLSTSFGLPLGLVEGIAQFLIDATIQQAMPETDVPAPTNTSGRAAEVREMLYQAFNTVGASGFSIALITALTDRPAGFELGERLFQAFADASDPEVAAEFFPPELRNSPGGSAMADAPSRLEGMPPNIQFSKLRVLGDIPVLETVRPKGMTPEARVLTFDEVWKAFGMSYPDTSFRNADWIGQYGELRTMVSYCESDTELFLIIRRLIASLQDANSRLVSMEARPNFHAPPGIRTDWVDGKVLITELSDEAKQAHPTLQLGMILESVDGEEVEKRVQRNIEYQRVYEGWPNDRVRRLRAANQATYGKPLSQATLVFKNADGSSETVEVKRARIQARKPTPAVEPKHLEGGVGYIKLMRFETGVTEQFEKAVNSFAQSKGLIIDLRGHESGLNSMNFTAECLGKLFPEQTIAGQWFGRTDNTPERLPFRITPRQPVYAKPVVVLVDGWTFGMGEVFAWCLQAFGRAKLVGEQTAGAVFDPRPVKRIGPGTIYMGKMGFILPKAQLIEGIGLEVDVPAAASTDDVRQGKDPVVEKARTMLLE